MEVGRIRELRLGRPFRPFTLVLNDGRRVVVELPFRLAISPKGGELAYMTDGEGPLFIAPSDVRDVEVAALQEHDR